jgi:hypothetical protein
MATLWISVLGFSSGRTGWVMTDGSQPYDSLLRPIGEAGVISRFEKDDCEELISLARKAEAIKVLSYDKTKHNDITLDQIETALDPTNVVYDNDCLADLMPEDD